MVVVTLCLRLPVERVPEDENHETRVSLDHSWKKSQERQAYMQFWEAGNRQLVKFSIAIVIITDKDC